MASVKRKTEAMHVASLWHLVKLDQVVFSIVEIHKCQLLVFLCSLYLKRALSGVLCEVLDTTVSQYIWKAMRMLYVI